MRINLFAASVLVLTVAVAPACASKTFVRSEVGVVDTKVDTLGTSLETTQERTRQNDTRIGVVDAKADAAGRSATDATTAAASARAAADAAISGTKDVDTRLSGRVNEIDTAAKRLVYEVSLSEDQGNFVFGGAVLPDDAKARLDEIMTQLKTDPKGVFIEIEGYTDNVGEAAYNEQLGMQRAETVKRYLYEQHQVPLHKMNAISYGENKPVAPNTTRMGRAQNRRIVVKVLS